jgi:hypothetical protein
MLFGVESGSNFATMEEVQNKIVWAQNKKVYQK